MARRDIFKTAESVTENINPHYDLHADDMEKLYNMVVSGYPCEALATAFRCGYALGQRAANKTKKPCQCANTDRASRKTNHGIRA